MPLTSTDWLVIVGYLLANLLIGIYYRRRASGNTEEFFISGRDVSWWLAGTSMVATTFAADTPLLVTGLVARQGHRRQLDLVGFMRGRHAHRLLLCALLAARRDSDRRAVGGGPLWRQACRLPARVQGGLSRAVHELLHPGLGDEGDGQHHYGSARAGDCARRCCRSAWAGHVLTHAGRSAIIRRCIICVFVLIPFTGLYTFIGGLWGVLVTDLFQFALKMAMIIVLAWVAVAKIGGHGGAAIATAGGGRKHSRSPARKSPIPPRSCPTFISASRRNALWTLPVLTFIVYLGMQWWLAWYPGAEPGGGGYVAQRMFSAKDEKNSLGATLWFNIAHYALRPWPWVITGLVALVVYSPHGGLHPSAAFAQNPEQGYVMVLRDYLPPALRGLMVAAFLAAFMSTIGTQLNWGSSYLVNDLYKRFIVRDATEKHYVLISKIFTVLLVLGSGYTATRLASINQGWQLVLNIGFGTGAVYILRWYWSRINAWSEIVAMAVAALMTIGLSRVSFTGNDSLVYAKTALITGLVTTIAWVIATFVTRPESDETLIGFYRRVHPTVYGWQADRRTRCPRCRRYAMSPRMRSTG